MGPVELVGQRLGGGRAGLGVGHFEDRGHAAQRGRAGAALQVLLVLVAGLAEMHLGVDHPGQDVEAGGVDDLGRGVAAVIANPGDAPVADGEIRLDAPARRHQRAAAQDQIVAFGHFGPPNVVPLHPVAALATLRAGRRPSRGEHP